jgi:hypothetical protein
MLELDASIGNEVVFVDTGACKVCLISSSLTRMWVGFGAHTH